jgi:ankyrin repeat protein
MMGELTALRKAALGRAADWRSEYDSRGFTPLHCAVHKGKDKVVAWLLSIGADPDAVVSMPDGSPLENVPGNVTSLYMATCLHDVIRSRLVSLLLKSGADPNHPAARDPVHGITSLHNAAFFGELSAVRALLKHGADAQALSLTGDTPATCASKGAAYASSPHGEISVWPGVGLFRHSHFQIAELLEKRAGAQPSTEDDGDNPQA